MDAMVRKHERQAATGDPEAAASVLRQLVRGGELPIERLKLASSLGHSAARLVCPDVEFVDWQDWEARGSTIKRVLRIFNDPTLAARLAHLWAEHVLHLWEFESDMVREALDSARAWIECPCEEHSRAAFDLPYPASNSPQSFYVANAASYALLAIDTTPFYGAGDASAAADAAFHASRDRAAECEWQRLRLADYVLTG